MELALEVLLWPFVACLVLTGIHTYLGLHVVSRGVIFVDLALAQIAAMGATFAFLLGYPPDSNSAYFYSLVFAWTGAAIFSISRLKEQHIPQEAIIGITFAVASATTILIADRSPQGAELVEAMLTGALLWTPRFKIIETALIYAAVGAFHWYFRDRFLTISLDHARAEAEGWNIRWWDFLFYASFGFVITSSVAIAGVLLVFSFLVIPSVIAMMFSHTIGGRLAIGWTAGTVVSMVGLSLSYGYDFPSGPAVVCTFGLALVAAATLRYVAVAERTGVALARTAAALLVIAGGLWLAFFAAGRDAEQAEERAASAATAAAAAAAGAEVPLSERIARAFAALEASPEEPPEAAMETLLEVGESLHLLMSTGEITVSESAVLAIAGAPDDKRLEDLLNEIAFHARDPWAKLRGTQALLERRNPLGVEAMLQLLSSSQPILLQMEGIESLRAATGQSFGYDPEADPAANGEALERWKSWWEANASQPFIGAEAR
jgi:zinc/manganese transport system permease protein